MRILVTNDDGIDSIGLHVLVRAMCRARRRPRDRRRRARHRVLGRRRVARRAPPDPPRGARRADRGVRGERGVGRDRSAGVVRDVLAARRVRRAVRSRGVGHQPRRQRRPGGVPLGHGRRRVDRPERQISGVAISQSVAGFAVEGQAWDEAIVGQHWESAAEIGRVMVQGLVDDMPAEPVVVNVNVPDVPLEEITAWKFGVVGNQPPRSMAGATLDPVPGHDGAFHVEHGVGRHRAPRSGDRRRHRRAGRGVDDLPDAPRPRGP